MKLNGKIQENIPQTKRMSNIEIWIILLHEKNLNSIAMFVTYIP